MEAIDDPGKEVDKVTRWFKNKTGHGDAAASKMARFYVLLSEADVTAQNEFNQVKSDKPKIQTNSSKPKVTKSDGSNKPPVSTNFQANKMSGLYQPSIHIDVQIHISPESSAEQIDKIFESMAKHLSGVKTI